MLSWLFEVFPQTWDLKWTFDQMRFACWIPSSLLVWDMLYRCRFWGNLLCPRDSCLFFRRVLGMNEIWDCSRKHYLHNYSHTCFSIESVVPGRKWVLTIWLSNDHWINVLKYAQHLRLQAFDSSVDISWLKDEFWLIVHFVFSEKLVIVVSVEHLAQHIVHSFALRGKLSFRMFSDSECWAVFITWVDGIPGSMSEDLLDHDEPVLLRLSQDQEEKGEYEAYHLKQILS